MPLTHYALLNAQPRGKTYKLFDGHGLYLQVAPSGGKWWRVKYRLRGREQCLSVGTFPAVALKAARQRCDELRAKLASGVDPAAERRLVKQQLRQLRTKDESFEVIAREWYATFSPNWAPSHGDRVLRRLETYVFPWIGKMPIRDVTAMNVLECLRRLEHQNTHETARRVLRYCSQTLRYDHYRPSRDRRHWPSARCAGPAEDPTFGFGQRSEARRCALESHRWLRRQTRHEVRIAVRADGLRPPGRAPSRSLERFRFPIA